MFYWSVNFDDKEHNGTELDFDKACDEALNYIPLNPEEKKSFSLFITKT